MTCRARECVTPLTPFVARRSRRRSSSCRAHATEGWARRRKTRCDRRSTSRSRLRFDERPTLRVRVLTHEDEHEIDQVPNAEAATREELDRAEQVVTRVEPVRAEVTAEA